MNNIVATSDIELRIPLEVLALEFGVEEVEYEPEQFPALVYRPPDHVVLIFSSGKILVTGLTTMENVFDAASDIASRVEEVV